MATNFSMGLNRGWGYSLCLRKILIDITISAKDRENLTNRALHVSVGLGSGLKFHISAYLFKKIILFFSFITNFILLDEALPSSRAAYCADI